MRVIDRTDWDRRENAERVLALGTFDGVHRGHRALLETGLAYARRHGLLLRVCTFDRHPLEVLCPEKAPRVLTPLAEKIRLMEEAGADELQLIPFTRETADMGPEAFLAKLREMVILRAVVAGWNYTFGREGRGNPFWQAFSEAAKEETALGRKCRAALERLEDWRFRAGKRQT